MCPCLPLVVLDSGVQGSVSSLQAFDFRLTLETLGSEPLPLSLQLELHLPHLGLLPNERSQVAS